MPNPSTAEEAPNLDVDPTRTTCYRHHVAKLAACCGLSDKHSADDVIKTAIGRITQSGTSMDLTFDEWLTLGNNYRTNTKEHG